MDVHMHICACGGRRLKLDILSSCSSSYFLAWISHWPGTELTDCARLAGQQTPGILRSLASYLWDFMDVLLGPDFDEGSMD